MSRCIFLSRRKRNQSFVQIDEVKTCALPIYRVGTNLRQSEQIYGKCIWRSKREDCWGTSHGCVVLCGSGAVSERVCVCVCVCVVRGSEWMCVCVVRGSEWTCVCVCVLEPLLPVYKHPSDRSISISLLRWIIPPPPCLSVVMVIYTFTWGFNSELP